MATETTHIGELRERVRLERFTAGAWGLDSVLWAKIRSGAPPRIPEAALVMEAATAPGERFDITFRYRSDLGDDARALRVRRGSDSLVVLQAMRDVDFDRRWSRLVCERFIAYAIRHDAMLATVAAQGAPVTFSQPTISSNDASTYDADSDTPLTPMTPDSIAGVAMALPSGGRPEENEPSTLILADEIMLGFVPNTYGDLPLPGATCTWGAETWAVKSIDPVEPDGVAIGARILIEK